MWIPVWRFWPRFWNAISKSKCGREREPGFTGRAVEMGVPAKKMSKWRTRKRRSIWSRIEAPRLTSCPQCHELILPHRVCPACGYYKARAVVKEKEKARK